MFLFICVTVYYDARSHERPLTHVSVYMCDCKFLHFNLHDFNVTSQISYAIGRNRSPVLLWLPTLRNNDMAGERSFRVRGHTSVTILFSCCLMSALNFATAADRVADPVGQAGPVYGKVTLFNRHAVSIVLKILDFKLDIKEIAASSRFVCLVPLKRTRSFIYLLCGWIEELVVHSDHYKNFYSGLEYSHSLSPCLIPL